MIFYLNTKMYGQVETLGELDSKDFPDNKSFRKEKKRLISEYMIAGNYGDLYWSSRSTKAWKE